MAHQQLTDRERYQIEALKAEGYRQTEIARSRRRSPSTICRELAGNSHAKGLAGKFGHQEERQQKSEKLDGALRSMSRSLGD